MNEPLLPARRRALVRLALLGATAPSWAQPQPLSPPSPVDALRAGGVAVLLRHATTTPGVGDPPGFRPGDCGTQRNLSDAGRAQAVRIGAWFAQRGLAPAAVRSSAWCRCLDTARLAFGDAVAWAPLDSPFGERDAEGEGRRARAVGAALRALPAGRFEVWVTHQINITEATGVFLGMGEGVLVRAGGDGSASGPLRPAVLAQLAFDG